MSPPHRHSQAPQKNNYFIDPCLDFRLSAVGSCLPLGCMFAGLRGAMSSRCNEIFKFCAPRGEPSWQAHLKSNSNPSAEAPTECHTSAARTPSKNQCAKILSRVRATGDSSQGCFDRTAAVRDVCQCWQGALGPYAPSPAKPRSGRGDTEQ